MSIVREEEKSHHPWFIPKIGDHCFKVKAVLRFGVPITHVRGYTRGKPKALYKCLYIGDEVNVRKGSPDEEEQHVKRSQSLRDMIADQCKVFLA